MRFNVDTDLFREVLAYAFAQYPDSRIVAVVLDAFPPFPAVTSSGSPLTVARPSRTFTGFLVANACIDYTFGKGNVFLRRRPSRKPSTATTRIACEIEQSLRRGEA